MKLIYLTLLLSFTTSASDCINPPKTWTQFETKIEREEEKSKLEFINIRNSFLNSGYKQGSKELLILEKSLLLSSREDWLLLKRSYLDGDKILKSKAPPLRGPILLCLVRNGKLIKEVLVATQ